MTADADPEATLAVTSNDHEDKRSVPVVPVTVGPIRTMRTNSEMSVFGYPVLGGVLVLLIPLLPVLAVIKLVDTLTGGGTVRRVASGPEHVCTSAVPPRHDERTRSKRMPTTG